MKTKPVVSNRRMATKSTIVAATNPSGSGHTSPKQLAAQKDAIKGMAQAYGMKPTEILDLMKSRELPAKAEQVRRNQVIVETCGDVLVVTAPYNNAFNLNCSKRLGPKTWDSVAKKRIVPTVKKLELLQAINESFNKTKVPTDIVLDGKVLPITA